MASAPSSVIVSTAPGASRPRTFSLEDLKERRSEKLVFTWYGDKGAGKTVRVLDLPGRIAVFAFDDKTQGIKDGWIPEAERDRIWVVDALLHYSIQPEEAPASAMISIDFIKWAIGELSKQFRPHWIVFDGTEMLEELADQKMRYLHGVKFSQGFKQRSWWKDRRAVLRDVFHTARRASEMGIAFTAYYAKTIGDEGDFNVGAKTPRWIDVMMRETDITIETRAAYSHLAHANTYEAYVLSAKAHLANIAKTGTTVDVTNKPFPWGPGLLERFQRVEKRLAGVKVAKPEVSEMPAEISLVILPDGPAPAPDSDVGGEDEDESPKAAAQSTPPPPPAPPLPAKSDSKPPSDRKAGALDL